MAVQGPLTRDVVLVAFEEYLRRTRGVCPETRHYYSRSVHAFLVALFGDRPVEPALISVPDVVEFVSATTHRCQPGTTKLVATSLRSFFRFLRAAGLREDRMEEAIPTVPRRRLTGLPRYLDGKQLAHLIASLDSSSPRGLRDRAILLCVARLACGRVRSHGCSLMTSTGATPPSMSGRVRAVTARTFRCRRTWAKRSPRTYGKDAPERKHGTSSFCTASMLERRYTARSSLTPSAEPCGTQGWKRPFTDPTCCATPWRPICSGTEQP